MNAEWTVRPLVPADAERVRELTVANWGTGYVVSHGDVYRPSELAGFAAETRDEIVGVVTYQIVQDACEIVTLASQAPGRGIASALVAAVEGVARDTGCRRLWLVTTNDNLAALRFYQKRGFALVAVRRNAVERARQLKPEIPLIGNDGIPIRDEIELERELGAESECSAG
ncbi:MAG: GNAT family N-acetyltransferase [Chloroflexi bacterium]|nr:GNAT family N-acetyltransferase [Chloroflexota bacterium]